MKHLLIRAAHAVMNWDCNHRYTGWLQAKHADWHMKYDDPWNYDEQPPTRWWWVN